MLLDAGHEIEILDGLAGRAFAEIVEARDNDKALAGRVQGEADVAKVGVRDVLELGQRPCRPDADHRAPGVELAIEGFDGIGGMGRAKLDIDGGKDSAGQREEMRGENHAVFGQAGVLENFRSMTMGEQVVGLEIFVDFDEVEVATRIFAGATGSGLAIAHDAAGAGEEAGIGKRAEGEDDAGGVAAGIGEKTGLGDLRGIEFGKTIDGFPEPV